MSIKVRDSDRIARICKLIYRIWNKPVNNDLRLMQLLNNALSETNRGLSEDFFYLEDDILEQNLMKFYNEKQY